MAKRILIIDDEPMIVESVDYNLKQEGYEVISAGNGDDGLKLAETEKVDLILLDLMLPGINGLEICRTIRQHSEVPIIILTAKEGEIDRVLGLELGADDYVTKPFSMRELIARIRTVLKRYNMISSSSSESEPPSKLHYADLEIDFLGHVFHYVFTGSIKRAPGRRAEPAWDCPSLNILCRTTEAGLKWKAP